MTLQYREQRPAKGETYRRFCELRYDGDRTVEGTALRYGDVATLPWGDKERFESGAFGNVNRADVILNFQHDRSKPLARTGGAGLEVTDSAAELSVRAVLPETTEANDAIALVRAKVMRGLSVEFKIEEYRIEGITPGKRGSDETMVIEKATLVGVAIVDRPAYPESKLRGDDMDEDKIKELIRAALTEQRGEGFDLEKAVTALAPVIRQVTVDVVKERDEAKAAEEQARQDATSAQQTYEAAAETRSELLTMVRGAELLPTGFDSKGKSNKDILVAAVGDEVKDAASQDENYLRAKVENIIERREQTHDPSKPAPTQRRSQSVAPMARPLSIQQMRAAKGA